MSPSSSGLSGPRLPAYGEVHERNTSISAEHHEPVLVQLDGGNDNVAGVDTDGCGGAVRLVALDTVDVDDPFLAVDLGHFSLPALVLAAYDADLVVLADGQGTSLRVKRMSRERPGPVCRTHVVLRPQLL
jgi:hypothetical protein